MDYVNGFMIKPSTRQVLCILKNRPDFQRGKWNGIGGKLEPGETPTQAMTREFREETGCQTLTTEWEHTIRLSGSDFCVYFYRAFVNEFPPYQSVTDEMVMQMDVDALLAKDAKVLENMKWILPLQLSLNIRFPLSVEWQRLN